MTKPTSISPEKPPTVNFRTKPASGIGTSTSTDPLPVSWKSRVVLSCSFTVAPTERLKFVKSTSALTSAPPVNENSASITLAVMLVHPVTRPLAAHRSKLSSSKLTGSKSSALAGAPLGVRNGITGEAVGGVGSGPWAGRLARRSEEHTSELQSPCNLVCRLLLEKKKNTYREGILLRNRHSTQPH